MQRILLAIVAALAANCAVVIVAERIGVAIWPIATNDLSTLLLRMPFDAKLWAVGAWFLGAVAAAMVAVAIGRRWWLAFAGTGWTLLGVGVNMTRMPHPSWMIVVGLIVPFGAALLVTRLMPVRPVRKRVAARSRSPISAA